MKKILSSVQNFKNITTSVFLSCQIETKFKNEKKMGGGDTERARGAERAVRDRESN